jgi:hypothetical protein
MNILLRKGRDMGFLGSGLTWSWYRVVRDEYRGYETQILRLWWPFWVELGGLSTHINTHYTIEEAEAFARKHALNGKTVLWLGRLSTRAAKKPEPMLLPPNPSPPAAIKIANESSAVVSRHVGEDEFVQAISGVLSS